MLSIALKSLSLLREVFSSAFITAIIWIMYLLTYLKNINDGVLFTLDVISQKPAVFVLFSMQCYIVHWPTW